MRKKRLLCAAVVLAVLSSAATARAAEDAGARAGYAAELVARADARKLADSRAWQALVHYETSITGKLRSLADDPRFFLSPDGRYDPHAELDATLTAFVDPESHRAAEGEDPRCAFPARYMVLDAQLHFDPSRMSPRPMCESYDRWVAGMRPAGLSMVFPEAYMNNPASMFGHTLLRVDADDGAQGRDLLAYAVNFAAETGTDGGVAFAWKGIAGGYYGYFSVMPYYEKLKQYGDWENRDIWEYRLDFTRDETLLVLAHVWELLKVSFPYYFFDDNCSYQLLAVLEVARPDLRLTADFPLWVIPVDTVRTTAQQEGLVAGASWRASPATRLRYAGAELSSREKRLALDVSAGRVAPDAHELDQLERQRRAVVLAQAYDDLRYRYLAGQVAAEESRRRSLAILRAVSVAGGTVTAPDPPAPRVRPENGHPSARVSLGGGVRDHDSFVELRLRPAFHELADPIGGYTPGAQIVILDTGLRWYPEHERLRLEDLRVVNVTSISPRDAFLHPVSWTFDTGLRTRLLPDASKHLDPELLGDMRGAAGLAWEPLEHWLAFGFIEAAIDAGPALGRDVAFGPGATIGILGGDPGDRARTLLTARATGYVLGDTTEEYRAGIVERVALGSNAAIEVETAWEHAYGSDWLDARVSLKWFFRHKWNGS